jgi:hypothetical protein
MSEVIMAHVILFFIGLFLAINGHPVLGIVIAALAVAA